MSDLLVYWHHIFGFGQVWQGRTVEYLNSVRSSLLEQISFREAPFILLTTILVLYLRLRLRRAKAAMVPSSEGKSRPEPQLELASALRSCRGVLVGIGLITAMLNVLYLTGSFFMLEV